MADEKEESRYKPLDPPVFRSSVPDHILARMPEAERYFVEVVTKMEERDRWMIAAMRDANHANIELDQRLARQEKILEKIMSKWAIIGYLLAAALPVALKVALEKWVAKP